MKISERIGKDGDVKEKKCGPKSQKFEPHSLFYPLYQTVDTAFSIGSRSDAG